jgi:hypothetical protein
MNTITITAAAVLLGASAAALATTDSDDQRQLHGMDVIGNRELPKALYVVPWQSAELGESTPSPFSGVFGEGLNPLDPEVFQRELDYYQAMQD